MKEKVIDNSSDKTKSINSESATSPKIILRTIAMARNLELTESNLNKLPRFDVEKREIVEKWLADIKEAGEPEEIPAEDVVECEAIPSVPSTTITSPEITLPLRKKGCVIC